MHGHFGLRKYLVDLSPRLIDHEFDFIQDFKVPSKTVQFVNDFLVIGTAYGTNQNELGIFRNFIIGKNLCPDAQLQLVILLRPELRKADNLILPENFGTEFGTISSIFILF